MSMGFDMTLSPIAVGTGVPDTAHKALYRL